MRLSRIGFMNRLFTRASTAAIERQNPELAGALKKLNTVAANPNPQAVQKAMSRLTPAERRAYMEAAAEQGTSSESANRQMRRQAERMQQQARGGTAGGGSGQRAAAARRRQRPSRREPLVAQAQAPVDAPSADGAAARGARAGSRRPRRSGRGRARRAPT